MIAIILLKFYAMVGYGKERKRMVLTRLYSPGKGKEFLDYGVVLPEIARRYAFLTELIIYLVLTFWRRT